jgi:uncharacterized membrane protein
MTRSFLDRHGLRLGLILSIALNVFLAAAQAPFLFLGVAGANPYQILDREVNRMAGALDRRDATIFRDAFAPTLRALRDQSDPMFGDRRALEEALSGDDFDADLMASRFKANRAVMFDFVGQAHQSLIFAFQRVSPESRRRLGAVLPRRAP